MNERAVKRLLLDVSREALQQGCELNVSTDGLSMFPFVMNGDTVAAANCNRDQLRYGDLIIYESNIGNDRITAHRLVKKNRDVFITKGDLLVHCDEPISPEMVMGKIVKIKRGNFTVSLENKVGRISNIIMLCVSMTRIIALGYRFLAGVRYLFRKAYGENVV